MQILKSATFIFLSFFLKSYSFSQVTATINPTEKLVLVNVTLTDSKDIPRAKDIVIFENIKSKKKYVDTTDAQGKFSLLLPKGETFNVIYKDFLDSTAYSQLEIPNKPGKYTSELSIQIEEPVTKTYTLDNVYFDTGLATLKPSSYKALNDLAEVMKLKTTLVIEIAGHTDNTGTSEINKKLSQDRADAVRNYLIKKGIAATRITAKGYGETEPIAENTTDEGKAKNRRTEVRIIKE
jgi:outer membrane protein OmpA-like peptidoglycan-associated protein